MPTAPVWAALTWWPFEPGILLATGLAALIYVAGGPARRPVPGARWRQAAFWSALLVLLLALQSPIDILARQLFWFHMIQHLLLITVVAPLLALASPWTRLWRGLPLGVRRPIARAILRGRPLSPLRAAARLVWRPQVIWVLAAAGLWAWHLPAAYDLTLHNHLVHHAEHAVFLALSVAFWAQVIPQHPFRARMSALQRAAYVFAAMLQSWVLAGILAFATQAFYAYALIQPRPWGISALADQQLGGGMMWVPGAISYSIAFVACLFLWLQEDDARGGRPAPLQGKQALGS